MILVSHRGNINGPSLETENSPNQVSYALSLGFHCEIDIWKIESNWFLGHDSPKYPVNIDSLFAVKSKLWLHCKNYSALDSLRSSDFNYFWHDHDDYVLTSHRYIWSFPGKSISHQNSVYVMPEKICFPFKPSFIEELKILYAVCSDYPKILQSEFEKK